MSVRKCAAICIGHRVNGFADHNYTMGSNSIPLRDHVVDLGVTVDSTLRYSVHINQPHWVNIPVFCYQGYECSS